MKNLPSIEKITKFRKLINENSNFVYQNYQNKDGKNYWNIICSCMDWITVSISYLNKLPQLDSDIDIRAMQVYSIISAVDIIFEAIQQLHRVFIDPTSKKPPFEGEKIFFSNRIYDEDDNEYFKSIRASFGAHPVNLQSTVDRKYASWPYHSYLSDSDLSISLYSNIADTENEYMNLYLSEIISFLNRRYGYLDIISERVYSLYSSEVNRLKGMDIKFNANPIEQLYILKKESACRLNNEYYNNIIDDLIVIFECSIESESLLDLVEGYRRSLLPLIEELYFNLQNMRLIELTNEYLLNPDTEITKNLHYEINKFYEWIASDQQDYLLEFYLKRFNSISDSKFNFLTSDSKELLFLKLNLMIYDSLKNNTDKFSIF